MKLNVPVKLELTTRYYLFNRQQAIKDVFDALVELITNSDDSYHRLYKRQLRPKDGGQILIEVCGSHKGNPFLIVRDRAEGMTLEMMRQKLLRVGGKSSEAGDRGFMARGAKDCTELGNVIIESMVDNKYYKCTITTNAEFIPQIDRRSVDRDLRKALHIERGNGTVVTIQLTRHSMPRPSTIRINLPLHFALRDIMAENSPTEILFRDINCSEKPTKIAFYQPEAELLCKEEFSIKGYPDARANLAIYRSPEELEDLSDKFRKSGLIIKGKRAIHECSLLQPSFERDPLGKKFFGRIECEYIDTLMEDYDRRREEQESPSIENPFLAIDPNRQHGLQRAHPFVKALLDIPTQRLKELIDKERQTLSSREDVLNDNLKIKFEKLAKAASKFLNQHLEDIEESPSGQEIEADAFVKRGILIFPTYANVAVDNVRSFGLYVNRKIFNKEEAELSLERDSSALEFLSPYVKLSAHKTRKDLLYGRFSIKGLALKEGICIWTKCNELPKAEALVNVVENKIEEHDFASYLEFEHKSYRIKEGSNKTLVLFAKYPELINKETEVKAISSDSLSLPIRGRCVLVPVQGSNFARAEIAVSARRLCSESINISVELNNNKAATKIKIFQKEEPGIPLKIEIRDEPFGNFRAIWADHEGKPYLLLISRRHPSLERYLGPAPNFKGRDSLHFRAILAEIVAECVCRKSLLLEAKHHSWMFQFANFKEDYLIADTVIAELHKRIKEFLPIAHQIMIEEKDFIRL